MIRRCKNCLNDFEAKFNNEKYCQSCKYVVKENKRVADRLYKSQNKEKIHAANKKYREDNREVIRQRDRDYYRKETDKRIASTKNSPNRKQHKSEYQKRKRQDPAFKLHQAISFAVNKCIKRNAGRKDGSIIDYLPYSLHELLTHLENQFEPWMCWNNWGVYDSITWNDEDNSTWTWQIDHIVPKSRFTYASMDNEEFNKCWALDNLRPYSAKKNIKEQDKR